MTSKLVPLVSCPPVRRTGEAGIWEFIDADAKMAVATKIQGHRSIKSAEVDNALEIIDYRTRLG